MSEASYGETIAIEIDNEPYLIQSVEFEDETAFLLKRDNEAFCLIMLDAHNEWKPDIDMSEEKFSQVMHWIKKLYLDK
jgi:hypothetical protein